MNVLLLGDSHGNHSFVHGALRWSRDNRVDVVIQVGDFGYWPKHKSGQGFLKGVGQSSIDMGVDLYFMDGNHEDHDELDLLQARHPDAQFMRVSKRQGAPIFIRRGHTWEWDGMTFGSFGGAFSIDRARRTKHVSWFPQEMPDPSLVAGMGKVDVLLTHDAPVVPAPYLASGAFVRDPTSEESQRTVYDALVATQPDWLVHGHWHCEYRSRVAGATVIGLAEDRSSLYASAVVVSTEDRMLYSLNQWEYRDE
jgi:hypothetical protein